MGRNTPILQEIIAALSTRIDDVPLALAALEKHFHDRLLVNAGSVNTVGSYAEQLRLQVTPEECPQVLDYIAEKKMVTININVVEDAINELLGWDRFIEP